MKAEELKEKLEQAGILLGQKFRGNMVKSFEMDEWESIYVSLKELESLKSKQTESKPKKYVLARDVEGVANKGVEVFLDEDGFWKAPPTDGGHVGRIENPIAHKDAIDKDLITEVKPREVWINFYPDGELECWYRKENAESGKDHKANIETVHFIEAGE